LFSNLISNIFAKTICNMIFNLFRKKSINFYPIDLKGYGNTSAKINSLQNDFALIDSYYNLSEIYIPISYLAKKIASIKFELFNKDNQVLVSPILDLISQPNNFDSYEELVQKFFVYKLITGNAYLNAVPALGYSKVSKITVLPPQYTKINMTNQIDVRLQEVKNYEFQFNDQNTTIKPQNILHFKDINISQQQYYYQYGRSRLLSARYNITSLEASYSTRCSLYQHGARHIMTGEGNEYNMLTPDQSKEEQRRINNDFGLTENQHQIMITRFPLKVTSLSKSVSELQLNEMNLADYQKICSLYEVPSILLNDNASSTYNNKTSAEKDFYVNVVIPQAKEFIENFVWWIADLLGDKNKYEVKIKTNSIEVLKDNNDQLTTRTISELQAGIITLQEARNKLGYESSI